MTQQSHGTKQYTTAPPSAHPRETTTPPTATTHKALYHLGTPTRLIVPPQMTQRPIYCMPVLAW